MKLTNEMMEKAKAADSPKALLQLAKENGVEISEAEANEYFNLLRPRDGAVSDEELENVTGSGCGGSSEPRPAPRYKIGSIVGAYRYGVLSEGQITARKYVEGFWFYWIDADKDAIHEGDIKYLVAMPE